MMVQDRLTDFPGLKEAVSAKLIGDSLLYHYAGNWWNVFSVEAAPYPQSAQDVIRFWKTQSPTLPIPYTFPPLGLLNVNALTGIELFEAHAVTQDVVTMLHKDIDRCLQRTRSLAGTIKSVERMKKELEAREEKELANIAAREVSQALGAPTASIGH